MHAEVRSWQARLAAVCTEPQHTTQHFSSLRAGLRTLYPDHADGCDRVLAELWQNATPTVRATLLAPLCDELQPGPQLTSAMMVSVAQGDARSANAALRTLGEGNGLDPQQWCQVGLVAHAQRSQPVPDIEAAAFLARYGPGESLATVALTAFRQGPEDADDRLLALAGLGRFDDARVPGWLLAMAHSGSAHLEVIQAAAQWLERDPQQAAELLEAVASADQGLDAIARWSAVQGLCHVRGAAALPQVLAAWRAGGEDLPADYTNGLLALILNLEPSLAQGGDEALRRAAVAMGAPSWPALPGLLERVASRDVRVARQAATQLGSAHPAVQQRAGVEATLVARKQLLGTLLPAAPAGALGSGWQPNFQRLASAERRLLEEQEAAWLKL